MRRRRHPQLQQPRSRNQRPISAGAVFVWNWLEPAFSLFLSLTPRGKGRILGTLPLFVYVT